MTDGKSSPGANPARVTREKRLAEALRANLRRRKQADRAGASGSDRDASTQITSESAENKDKRG